MKLGRAMHVPLPEDVTVVGVSIRRAYDFSEELSPAISEALPKAVQIIMRLTM
jgi:hypothetical protein